jgi:putative ABC transport system substrate-binding protein
MGGTEADPESKRRVTALLQGLEQQGWALGRNLVVEVLYAQGRMDSLNALAARLAQMQSDVIVTSGTESVQAAVRAGGGVPIVMASIGDPVGASVVASLARPGGIVTGLSLLATDLSAKRLELLKEALPATQRVAVLWNPGNASVVLKFKEKEMAASSLRMTVVSLQARQPEQFANAFETAGKAGAEAVLTTEDAVQVSNRNVIVSLATHHRLPVMSEFRSFADAGALMSYGPSIISLWRRSAAYVSKILNGAKPAELPIEQPTRFELVINLKTAKTLGIAVPPTLIARADEVIE